VRIICPESVVGIVADIPDDDCLDQENILDYTLITAMGLLRVGADTLVGIGDEEVVEKATTKKKLGKVLKN
jgi:hypothetical protein